MVVLVFLGFGLMPYYVMRTVFVAFLAGHPCAPASDLSPPVFFGLIDIRPELQTVVEGECHRIVLTHLILWHNVPSVVVRIFPPDDELYCCH